MIVAVTVFVAVSITDTVPEMKLVTYARVPSGRNATPPGLLPTAIVAITAFVAVLVTDTVFEPWLVTYARVPSGLTAAPFGLPPTVIVAVTVFDAVSITDTVFEPKFVTYARTAATAGPQPTLNTTNAMNVPSKTLNPDTERIPHPPL